MIYVGIALGVVFALVSILLVGICRAKGDEREEEADNRCAPETGERSKVEFDTVCIVMRLIRSRKVDSSTPNWKVYSEAKKWKEACNG